MVKKIIMSCMLTILSLVAMDDHKIPTSLSLECTIKSDKGEKIDLIDDIIMPGAPNDLTLCKQKEAFLKECHASPLRPYNGAKITKDGYESLAPYEYLKTCNVQSLEEMVSRVKKGEVIPMFPLEMSVNSRLTSGLMIGTILGRYARRISSTQFPVVGEKMRPDVTKEEEQEAKRLVGEEESWVELDQLVAKPILQGRKLYPLHHTRAHLIYGALTVVNMLWHDEIPSIRTHLKEGEKDLIEAYEACGFTKYEHQYMQDGLIVYHKKLN